MNSYTIGQVIRLTATFTQNSSGLDPTAVRASVREPSGTVTTYLYGTDTQLAKDSSSTGVYRVDWTASTAGTHDVRFWSTGTGQAAVEGAFSVRQSRFQ
jgi:hypothetical protein